MKKILLSIATILLSSAASAAPVLNTDNGHYYEYVAAPVTFDAALAAAASLNFGGRTGYLATVTSDAERDFIFASVTQADHWLAGTDRDDEGTWRWVAGPESGQIFWQDGTTVTYASWGSLPGFEPEPNNVGDEDGLIANFGGNRIYWNDSPLTNVTGYVVEYGPVAGVVPEPATWAMMIGGVGMAGGTLRRRKANVSVRYA